MSLATSVLAGERLAMARLLSQIENDEPGGREALGELFPHTGKAHLVGVTGAPGTGKSSLVNRLAHYYRNPSSGEPQRKIAIVAVDPSSPFTGGAILGDRVRMRDLSGDPGVFIRSMAARGSLGGLAPTTSSMVQVFDAAGFEIILIETVGAGQAEVDIARLAHTTLVVEAPGLGDEIQAIKAGILEIADILVVNKADRPGVENTERALRSMLELAHPTRRVVEHHGAVETININDSGMDSESLWIPPILRTVAIQGDGIPELVQAIADHQAHLETTGERHDRDRARLQAELEQLIQGNLVSRWRQEVSDSQYQEILESLIARQISPHQAVEALLNGGQSA
ncbi:MAG: methylmalonyl Co-A mutase-associated GTPase MeaB [Chloroflexota bacterium]|nr:MAG: methylmalonyl Co-A mutase-associated GTPase MeaB [Chloroflexota bacterium]